MDNKLRIRMAEINDAESIVSLSYKLGYQPTFEEIKNTLFKFAESWAKNNGCNKIRIRTNLKRVETVEYYSRLGLISIKTQEVFEKSI